MITRKKMLKKNNSAAGRCSIRCVHSQVLSMKEKCFTLGSKNQGSVKIGLASACFLLVALAVFSGAVYLFQVNSLAVKSYEIKELEDKIGELKKENKKMQIKEMELRSIYSIEKSAENFNLVNPKSVSYLETGAAASLE